MEENKGNGLDDVTELTYLHLYNPLRWEGNIKNNFYHKSDEKVLKMLTECGTAYLVEINKSEKDFQWYLPEIREEFGLVEGNPLADWFLEERMKNHMEYIEDVKQIYSIVRGEAVRRGMDVKRYPDTLEELTE